MLMRVLDLAGPILCAIAALCFLAGLAVDIDSRSGEGADGRRRDPVPPGRVPHPRLRSPLLRPRTVKAVAVLTGALAVLLALAAGADAARSPVVVIDPGHDLRANLATEPIGPGAATRKIKDGGGTRGVVSGTREAELVLDVSLRLRRLLQRAGVRVVMTRSAHGGDVRSGTSPGPASRTVRAPRCSFASTPTGAPTRRPGGRTSSSPPSGPAGRTTSTGRAGRRPRIVLA